MKTRVNLFYFDVKFNGHRNFGDAISVFITDKLIDKDKYEIVYNRRYEKINLICVGSYLQVARNGYHIYGSGVRRLDQVRYYKTLNVSAVRGPKTREYLIKNGIDCPEIYGDPALLLSIYYKPIEKKELHHKIGIVPHFSNYSKYINNRKYNDDEKYHIINPCNDWREVINQITSCKCILSSSLHGLICSDAYGIPNVWLNEFPLAEGEFKFQDYFSSQDRDIVYIKSIESFEEDILYREGNKIDLDILKEAFPFK